MVSCLTRGDGVGGRGGDGRELVVAGGRGGEEGGGGGRCSRTRKRGRVRSRLFHIHELVLRSQVFSQ